MLLNEESTSTHLTLKGGIFHKGQGEAAETFNTLGFQSFGGIKKVETDNGDMVCIRLFGEAGEEGAPEYIIWAGERDFIDFARRIITRELWGEAPVVPGYKLKPYYKEKEARGLALYEFTDQWKLVKVMSQEDMAAADIPAWEKSGKFWDSSAQFAELYQRAAAILGDY